MFGWIGRLFRRPHQEYPEIADDQEQRQAEQFDAWSKTLKEVDRIQEQTGGRKVSGEASRRALRTAEMRRVEALMRHRR